MFGHSLWNLHGECPKTDVLIVMEEGKGRKAQEIQNRPKKSHIAESLGGHRLDE